jgi:hypothetical protein
MAPPSPKTIRPTVNNVSDESPLLAASSASIYSDGSYNDIKRVRYTFCLGLLLIFLIAGSNFLLVAPITQLKELALCKSYYDSIWKPESNCKIEPIQSALASLIGWQQLLDCLPGA